jgi:hypothetical protein
VFSGESLRALNAVSRPWLTVVRRPQLLDQENSLVFLWLVFTLPRDRLYLLALFTWRAVKALVAWRAVDTLDRGLVQEFFSLLNRTRRRVILLLGDRIHHTDSQRGDGPWIRTWWGWHGHFQTSGGVNPLREDEGQFLLCHQVALWDTSPARTTINLRPVVDAAYSFVSIRPTREIRLRSLLKS